MPSLLFQDIKKLYEQSFLIEDWTVYIPTPPDGWPRKGAEGFGLPVKLKHASHKTIDGFLKVFLVDVPQREKRNLFLVEKGMAKLHELFHGMPFAIILNEVIAGVTITGHIAHQLNSEQNSHIDDINLLKENEEWDFSWDERKALCESLCVSVAAMEKHNLVHGDIAPGNVIITKNDQHQYLSKLCDFDSFYHPNQPLLPIKHENIMIRTLGNPGYQYYELTKLLKENKVEENTYVKTDRFALGALLCEIMVWENGLESKLKPKRKELLTEDMILNRDIGGLPLSIRNKWKDGFSLLEQALKCTRWQDLPSAEQWLEALGFSIPSSILSSSFVKEPIINIAKVRGNTKKDICTAHISNSKGNFEKISSELKSIDYDFNNQKLIININWTDPIFHIKDGKRKNLGKGPKSIGISPNDEILSGFWNFHFK